MYVYVNLNSSAAQQKACNHSWDFLAPAGEGYSVYRCLQCGVKAVDVAQTSK